MTSRSLDDERWVVAHEQDVGPLDFYLYERDEKKLQFLFSNRPELNKYELAPMIVCND